MDEILDDLRDRDPEIKRMAAKALVQQSGQTETAVLSVLEKADRSTVMVIYDVLFNAPGDFSNIFRLGTRDNDPEVRCQAIRYLFRSGAFKCQEGLEWLDDEDPYVRRRVISYLSWLGDRSTLKPILGLATRDPDPCVRRDALRLVSVWARREEAGGIIAALDDKVPEVRTQAIQALKKITGEDFGDPSGATEDELEWIVARWQGWWEITKEGH